jgi:hypothetical protein
MFAGVSVGGGILKISGFGSSFGTSLGIIFANSSGAFSRIASRSFFCGLMPQNYCSAKGRSY